MTRPILGLELMAWLAVVTAACSPAATPSAAPTTTVPIVASAPAARAPTQPPLTPTDVPTPAPTLAPTPQASETVAPVVVAVECEVGLPWLQTREELILVQCFNPYPPQLGAPAIYEALLTDATGQPLADATVELARRRDGGNAG